MDYEDIPLGLSFGLARDVKASAAYGQMSDSERKQVVDEAKGVSSKAEMEQLVNRIGRGL